MNNNAEIRFSVAAPMSTAHEIINLLHQRETVVGIYKEHASEGLVRSDAMYMLSHVTPDPIARALFRKWYVEADKEEISALRLCANLASAARYGAAAMRHSLQKDALEELCENWIKPAKNNHDYFSGPVQEETKHHLWYRDTFVSAYGGRGGAPISNGLLSNTIRFMLLYGNKLYFNNYIFDIPYHIRSLMIRRNMIRK